MKKSSRQLPGSSWRKRMHEILRETFGLRQLRDGQATVIEHVMSGRSVLAVMPTGAGKSLCFQLPALLLPGRTVVVSPLIALMKDQCDKLAEMGVAATQLHSGLTAQERSTAEQAVADGSARLVFVTPERLAEPAFLAILRSHPVSLFVIDEAHCISQWGHDFRPAFLEIGTAAHQLGRPVTLALTATAPPEIIDDVLTQLGGGDMAVVNLGVYRPNLQLGVQQITNPSDKMAAALSWVASQEGAGLVYAATVKAVDEVHAALQAAGESATRYHGRLPAAERRRNQDLFMSGQARVMVATNAFGLGIDKHDTRFVLHHQLPGGLDAYYQEAGRAGRDGQSANCLLLHYHADKAVQSFFLAGKYPSVEDVQAVVDAMARKDDGGQPWTSQRLFEQLSRSKAKVQVALSLLREAGVVSRDRRGVLLLQRPGLGLADLTALVEVYQQRREHDQAELERMVFYGQTGFCRWKVLLEHYGEDAGFERCGRCDNCEKPIHQSSVHQEDLPVMASPARSFTPGQRVRVPRYGEGEVITADAETVTLMFPGGKQRSFMASYAKGIPFAKEAPVETCSAPHV